MKHNAYAYRKGCRCDECTVANRERVKESRRKRKARLANTKVVHGASTYTNWGCRCEVCTTAHSLRIKDTVTAWRAANPERSKAIAAKATLKSQAKQQAQTLEAASRRYQPWTGPELELAARSDISSHQLALQLGRTFAAVKTMRHKMKREPRLVMLAGIPNGTTPADDHDLVSP